MQQNQVLLLCLCAAVFLGMGLVVYFRHHYSLNRIKSKVVGDGQHGTARWATKSEIHQTYKRLLYTPNQWRKGENRPEIQGLIVGCEQRGGRTNALIDDGDVHCLMIGASGVGKTAAFLYPNIEYACAAGMSFVCTDSKGDVYRNTATIAEKYYGYSCSVIDLRNPTRSDGYNMLFLVNKYMDLFLSTGELPYKAKAEKFAKIVAKTIITANSEESDHGQNSFFYDAAEGLLAAVVLLIAEFCEPAQRHIVSIFKLIQDMLGPSPVKGKNQFQLLMEKLPSEHKARWLAGAALNTSDQAMASVLSTALSRLNGFLDSELEQVLCFDSSVDVERFCTRPSAIYLVLPEEDQPKHFIVSLIFQQICRELLMVADERGGKLPNRVMLYADELGTLPAIQGLEMLFSASRSRRVTVVAIIQSLAQLQRNYGKEGADIIGDNCQLTLFGGFAPNSSTADTMSENLGSRTVMSGSVNQGNGSFSQSLQMMKRQLMTTDELKAMPKGQFIVMKTGCHPMRCRLPLFFKWGVAFEKAYTMPEQGARKVEYANRNDLEESILQYTQTNEEPAEDYSLRAPIKRVIKTD